MQTWRPDGTRQERTGWRDARVSARHREWGFHCPAVDLDFLVAEYNVGKPVALIEYKHFQARMPMLEHPTYRALTDLSDNYSDGSLPFIVAFYWPGIWAFRAHPVNGVAKAHFVEGEMLTEREFVTRLYRLRRLRLTRTIHDKLNDLLPTSEAAE